VRRLVELHGGAVAAYSDGPGRGSEFVIRLPILDFGFRVPSGRLDLADKVNDVRPGVVEVGAGPSGRNAFAGNPKSTIQNPQSTRVLVVDDNLDAAATLAELLELWGYEVRLAHEGPAAVEEAVRFRPDVALLDIGLPGMNGYELARQLRAKPESAETVLIALTGYGQEEDRRQAQAAGFTHHLVKPVDLDRLEALLAAEPSISPDLPRS